MKLHTKLAIATALALAGTSAWAQSANGNLNVSASVAQSCTITTSPVAFGAYDPIAANATNPLNASGALNVTCTKGASSIELTLGNGGNHDGSTRRMTAGSGNFLAYELYHPSATTPGATCNFPGTQVWGTAGAGIFQPSGVTWAAGSAQTFNVCGTIAAGIDAAAGTYTDVVVATVNF